MTFKEIRAALPTHIMLTPGLHRWLEGDEPCIVERSFLISGKWEYSSEWGMPLKKNSHLIGQILQPEYIGRRPIPPHILDNQAFWVLFDMLAEIPPHGVSGWLLELERGITDFGDIRVLIHNVRGLFYGHARRFRTKDDAENAMELLGGQNRIIRELEIGRLYDKWLLEQMEDV